MPLAAPVPLEPADTVKVTCSHERRCARSSPRCARAARYVVWGEGTTDEMCLGILIRD